MTDQLVTFNPNGTMSSDDPAYVERKFERDVFSTLSANQWASLLGPRQYGKSSAFVRIQARLTAGGYACAFVDIQGYGGSSTSYPEFLEWFAEEIADAFGTRCQAPSRLRRASLEHWLRATLPDEVANAAIFIDEASGVPPDFRTRFYSQLRAFHNLRSRARGPETALATRLVFAFAGTFRPARLIDNKNSPFNVAQESNCDDLTRSEVTELAALGLGDDANAFAARAFEATQGQPYYVQHLFAAVQRAGEEAEARHDAYGTALQELQSGVHGHLEHLTGVVDADPDLIKLVPKILAGDLEFEAGNGIHHYAVVSGVARRQNGRLIARNPIYANALRRFAQVEPEPRFPA